MNEKHKTQYTIRDIPERTNTRLREVAACMEISLNQAAVRALERGLGVTGQTVSYRKLKKLVPKPKDLDKKAWDKTLSDMDRVNPKDWE